MAGPRRGPMGKRDDERERRNAKPGGDAQVFTPEDMAKLPFEIELLVEPPTPSEKWEHGAVQFYEALLRDPARIWMGPADWAAAWLICENMHRELAPQYVAVKEGGIELDTGEKIADSVVRERLPIKGASLTAYIKWMSSMGIGEASRMALRKEVTFHEAPAPALASVTEMDIVEDREDLFQDGAR